MAFYPSYGLFCFSFLSLLLAVGDEQQTLFWAFNLGIEKNPVKP